MVTYITSIGPPYVYIYIVNRNSLLMSKKKKVYSGVIEAFPNKEILLNVNHLEKGRYSLKILYKNKVIKHTTFKK